MKAAAAAVRTLTATLARLPRIPLGVFPTPLHPAERLSAALGGPEIWLKRDDLNGFALGGNKVRPAELLAGEAVRRGADALITGGRAHSNHVRVTLAAAAHLGLEGFAEIAGEEPAQAEGNLLLDRLFGGEIRHHPGATAADVDGLIEQRAGELRAAGRVPYAIGRGGACAVGCAGYALASLELAEQLTAIGLRPRHLFHATGSCCTQAGLLLGTRWLTLGYRVHGIAVSRPRDECEIRIRTLVDETAELLGIEPPAEPGDLIVCEANGGVGALEPTADAVAAIRLLARTEAILLDSVYAGRALAALVSAVRSGEIGRGETVLFLVTGGTPDLFTSAAAAALLKQPA